MKRFSQIQIVRELSEDTAKQVTRPAVLALQRMTDFLGSGDDSELKNTWEEVCVHVQYDQSVMWDGEVKPGSIKPGFLRLADQVIQSGSPLAVAGLLEGDQVLYSHASMSADFVEFELSRLKELGLA